MMDNDERTFRTSEIREQRRRLEQRLALQQRELDALAKMDEAAAELEQVEREMEALSRGDAEPQQPAEAVHTDSEPNATGERSAKILKDKAGTWLVPREIMAEMDKRGWVDGPPDLVIGRLRHSLRRLADNHPNIERDESDTTYRYRWRADTEDDSAPALVPYANGVAYPVPQGGAG
jgi:hypothetical protein